MNKLSRLRINASALLATVIACIWYVTPALCTASGDYFYEIARDYARKWPQSRFPLKVYIPSDASSSKIAGYRPEFRAAMHDAFLDWQTQSHGLVNFRFVDDASQSDIDCTWIPDNSGMDNKCWWGQTKTEEPKSPAELDHAKITLVTTESDRRHSAPVKRIRVIALHEVGHALGFLGHSPSAGDIMYPAKTDATTERELSSRDLQTLAHLYRPDAQSLRDTVNSLDVQGKQLTKEGKFQSALEKFDAALRYEHRSKIARADRINCLQQQSRQLIRTQQYTEALPVLQTTYGLTMDDQISPGTHIQTTRDLAAVYEHLGKYPAAISKLHELAIAYRRQEKLSEAKAVEATIADLENRNK